MDIIFAGGKFRAKSKFTNIAKISSTRKIGVIQYFFAINMCIVVSVVTIPNFAIGGPTCATMRCVSRYLFIALVSA